MRHGGRRSLATVNRSSARCVCAPQYRSLEIVTTPNASFSMRDEWGMTSVLHRGRSGLAHGSSHVQRRIDHGGCGKAFGIEMPLHLKHVEFLAPLRDDDSGHAVANRVAGGYRDREKAIDAKDHGQSFRR